MPSRSEGRGRRRPPHRAPIYRGNRPPRPARWTEIVRAIPQQLIAALPLELLQTIRELTFPAPAHPLPRPPRIVLTQSERNHRLMVQRLTEIRERTARRARRARRIRHGFHLPITRTAPCACVLLPGQPQPEEPCSITWSCPNTGRPVRVHLAPGLDESYMEFALREYDRGGRHVGDLYSISADEYSPPAGNSPASSSSSD